MVTRAWNRPGIRAFVCLVTSAALSLLVLGTGAPAAAAEILVVDGGQADGTGGVIRIDTVTGAQTVVSTGENFSLPAGIERAPDGQLFVTDLGPGDSPSSLMSVDPLTGAQTVVSLGRANPRESRFGAPSGIAFDPAGNLVVADPDAPGDTGFLFRVNPATGAQSVLATGGSLVDPSGIVFDPSAGGSFLVADLGDFGSTGSVIRVNSVTGAQTVVSTGGNFVDPYGIAIAPDGSILVADPGEFGDTGSIIRVDPTTGAQTVVATGGNLVDPFGIATDATGRIFVTDTGLVEGGGRLIAIDPATGTQTIIASGENLVTPFDLVVVPIPEPSTLGGVALAGLLLLGCRRR